MAQEGHTTFQEVFVMASPIESIKLLPWCVSSALQWGKNTLATTAAPEPKVSTTLGPSNSPAYCSESYFLPTQNLHTEEMELPLQQFTQPPVQQEDPCWLPRSQTWEWSPDTDDEAAAESLQNTGDQASMDSNSAWDNVEDPDRDTTSGDGVSYSDTQEVSIWTACKRYQKRVGASCSLWTETQLKRIGKTAKKCGDMTTNVLEQSGMHSCRNHSSFEM